jgi:hypothetical protein
LILGENQNLYEKVEKHVSRLFEQAGKEPVLFHSRRTVFWLLKLKPDADQALKIAALAHDIERVSPPPPLEYMVADSSKGWLDPEFLRLHSIKGSEIIEKLLNRLAVEPEIIEKIKFLVAGHEFAGTCEQNVLKDADSVSFFENNVEEFLQIKAKKFGKEKVRAKLKWMYNRITSEKAKRTAAPWYELAMKQLDIGEANPGCKCVLNK